MVGRLRMLSIIEMVSSDETKLAFHGRQSACSAHLQKQDSNSTTGQILWSSPALSMRVRNVPGGKRDGQRAKIAPRQ